MKDIDKNHVDSKAKKILDEIDKVTAVTGAVSDNVLDTAIVVGKTGALGKDGMVGAIVADEIIKSGLLKRLFRWLFYFWR